MKWIISLACLGLVLAACNDEDSREVKILEQHVKLRDTSFTFQGALKNVNDTVSVPFDVNAGDQVQVMLIPDDSTSNLRINQIIFPGGETDGPLGRIDSFGIRTAGLARLIISANKMAEGNWQSPFTVRIRRH